METKPIATPIITLDLTKQAPHSPRERVAGFAIAVRAIDKCRASLAGTPGEYHYDCPMDKMLFDFKGITGEQFKAAVQASKYYQDVGDWLQADGGAKGLSGIIPKVGSNPTFSPNLVQKDASIFCFSGKHRQEGLFYWEEVVAGGGIEPPAQGFSVLIILLIR